MWDLIVPVPDHCLSFYFSPWRTPVWQGKKAEVPSAVLTVDFILLYILVIKV